MIGIITVNWRGYDITCQLIQQVLDNGHQDFRFILVNNSADEVEKFDANPVNDPRIQVIHSKENKGFSGGINMGLKVLLPIPEISHFIIMNNDVELEKDFIEQMLARAPREERIYSPLIYLRDTDLIYNTGGKVHVWLGGTVNQNNHVPVDRIRRIKPDYFTGCILFMHRRVIERVGLLDEDFGTYYEDVDFCTRAKKLGIELEMVWAVRARHFHSYSTKGKDNVIKIYLLNRNQILFAKKHLKPLPRMVFITAAVVRGFLFNLKPKRFPHYWRGVREGLGKSSAPGKS